MRQFNVRILFALICVTSTTPTFAQTCVGDIAIDNRIDGGDLGVMLANWGPVTSTALSRACDLDGNSIVNGADLGMLLANWGYCPATISSVSPSQGCLLGGTEVTITGTHLGSVEAVTIGGLPCSGVIVDSPTLVRATVPAGVSGAADVAVTTLGGTTVSALAFTYRDMVVSVVSPSVGPPAGGTVWTITGECLGNVTAVSVGSSLASAVTVVNASTVTAITPPGPLGAADVVVSGGKGSTTVPGGFTYQSIVVPSWATLIEAYPDPAVVTDPALRAAIIATGRPWRVRDTGTGIEMLLVPPGTFLMGCIMGSDQSGCLAAELPVHQVTLTHAFYIGRFEVTQAQWQLVMGFNPSFYKNASAQVPLALVPERPVDSVSWSNTQSFLAAVDLRLPTEAEWEFACRAGTQTPFHNNSVQASSLGSIAWFQSNSANQTRPVGRRAANALGLHDMIGNVLEWVADRYGAYSANSQVDPTGSGGGVARVQRGGTFGSGEQVSRSSTRVSWDVSQPAVGIPFGFRVARNP
jgi:formylglycine-generating enzyme required for sulfatase activity